MHTKQIHYQEYTHSGHVAIKPRTRQEIDSISSVTGLISDIHSDDGDQDGKKRQVEKRHKMKGK